MSELTTSEQGSLFADERQRYWVKPMSERHDIASNGLIAVSTFSGSGGSSLGLKAAGFEIPYANEFTPHGRATYAANHPDTCVDSRDIRTVEADEILELLDMQPGELDLFEGSPPCSSFSAAGVRAGQFEDKRGKVKPYSGGIKQATDDLFEEWVRLIAGVRPKAILAENVPDMAKPGPAADYLFEIQSMLRELDYNLQVRVHSSTSVGCATRRKRLIIVGVRNDVGVAPFVKFTGSGFTLREGLATLPVEIPDDEMAWSWTDARSLTGTEYAVSRHWYCLQPGEGHSIDICKFPEGERTHRFNLVRAAWDRPVGTFTATGGHTTGSSNIMHPDEPRNFTATEIAWLSGFPADYVLTGSPGDRYERIGRAVVPPLYEALGPHIARVIKGGH